MNDFAWLVTQKPILQLTHMRTPNNNARSPSSPIQPGPVQSNYSSPDINRTPDTPPVVNHLSGFFGGLSLQNLFKGLHALFGQGRVVMAGSTAKALQVSQLNDADEPFRPPNDIDLVVSAAHLELAPLHNPAILKKYGLTMPDPNKSHVLEYRDGAQSVKIDLVSSGDTLFQRAFEETIMIEGMPVTRIETLCDMDRTRLLNGEGNAEQLKADLRYFKPYINSKRVDPNEVGQRSRTAGAICKSLF